MLMPEKVLTKYKKYLMDLEYPFIKEKADYELQNIFESKYREFLLSWIMTKFIPAYNNKLEESKKNNKLEQVLANIIYENGFCRAAEKEGFVKGNLDMNTQIIIFDRIFHMLSLTHTSNFSTDDSKENMPQTENYFKQIFMKPSIDNFKSNILQDVTLISTLGVSSKMSDDEKKNKMKFYRDEIENLQNILEEIGLNDGESDTVACSSNRIDSATITEKIEKLTSKFTDCTNQFKIDDFITVTENNEEDSRNQILEYCVENNADNLNALLKTIQKKCDLNEIMNDNLFDQDEDLSNSNDYFACVLQNYAMSDNILQEINRNTGD